MTHQDRKPAWWTLDQALAWVKWRDAASVDRVGPKGDASFSSLLLLRNMYDAPALSAEECAEVRQMADAQPPDECAAAMDGGVGYSPDAAPHFCAPPKVGDPDDLLAMLRTGQLGAWGRCADGKRLETIPAVEWAERRGNFPRWNMPGWRDIELASDAVVGAFPAEGGKAALWGGPAIPDPPRLPEETPTESETISKLGMSDFLSTKREYRKVREDFLEATPKLRNALTFKEIADELSREPGRIVTSPETRAGALAELITSCRSAATSRPR